MKFKRDIQEIQNLYEQVVNSSRIISENRDIWGATLVPEVRMALFDWMKNTDSEGIVIGGCALGVYTKPRTTTDADILFLGGESSLPLHVEGFKKTRKHAFEHIKTGVEIETLTPEYLKLSPDVVDFVKDNLEPSGGIRIASKSSMILLKAQRLSPQDRSDIFSLFETLGNFPDEIESLLTPRQYDIVMELWNESKNDSYSLID
jgi:hypothetical protein